MGQEMVRFFLFLILFCFQIFQVYASASIQEAKKLQKVFLEVIKLYQGGKYEKALVLAEKNYASAQKIVGDEHPVTLAILNNLAGLYRVQGYYDKSKFLMKRGLDTSLKLLGKDHLNTLNSQNNLAGLYQDLGQYQKAESLYLNALESAERVHGKDSEKTLLALNNLGTLYQAQWRYVKAEILFKRIVRIAEKAFGSEDKRTLTIVNNLASVYHVQGLYSQAEDLFKRVLDAQLKTLGKTHPDSLITMNNIASLYQDMGKLEDAEKLFKPVFEIRAKRQGQEHPDTLLSMNNLGEIYRLRKKYTLSKKLNKKAFKLSGRILGPTHPQTLRGVNNLAALYDSLESYDQAERLYKRSLVDRKKLLGEQHPETLISLSNLADLYLSHDKWNDAFYVLDDGTRQIAKRSKLAGVETFTGQKTNAAQKEWDLFKLYLVSAYRVIEADEKKRTSLTKGTFERSQLVQGLGASAALAQIAARFGSGDNELGKLVRERQDLIREWKDMDRHFNRIIAKPVKQRNKKLEKAINDLLDFIVRRIGEIDKVLNNEFPNYFAITHSAPLKIKEVQSLLKGDEALVYMMDLQSPESQKQKAFIWVVTKSDVKWVRTEFGTKQLNRMVKTLRCGLDVISWGDKQKAKDCNLLLDLKYSSSQYNLGQPLPFKADVAYELYKGLFGQVEDLIKDKKLLLVPSGILTSLPFQVLVTAAPKKENSYHNLEWLVKKHNLSVLPSVGSLKDLRKTVKPSAAKAPYLAFANPLLIGPDGNDERAWLKQACVAQSALGSLVALKWLFPQSISTYFRGGDVDIGLLKRQYPLPETADEVCAVGRVLNALPESIKLGEKATEDHIKELSKNGVLKNAKVLHFATHGLLAEETALLVKNKTEPALILTPPDKASKTDDGLLTTSEIAQLKLDADWVILSACNTAAGDKPGAEPLSGLAKAFFYAGARSLLVSHWYVNSQATVKLITNTFQRLRADKTLSRAGALRSAMLNLVNDKATSHPEYWAPFVVIGAGE